MAPPARQTKSAECALTTTAVFFSVMSHLSVHRNTRVTVLFLIRMPPWRDPLLDAPKRIGKRNPQQHQDEDGNEHGGGIVLIAVFDDQRAETRYRGEEFS